MCATGALRRGLPSTKGSVSGLTFFSVCWPITEMTSGYKSEVTFDKSRILPALSSMPGFSPPSGP
jgi:hypothetical protein